MDGWAGRSADGRANCSRPRSVHWRREVTVQRRETRETWRVKSQLATYFMMGHEDGEVDAVLYGVGLTELSVF
jgi:hypothetical protein